MESVVKADVRRVAEHFLLGQSQNVASRVASDHVEVRHVRRPVAGVCAIAADAIDRLTAELEGAIAAIHRGSWHEHRYERWNEHT